jgi:hypothetical protein
MSYIQINIAQNNNDNGKAGDNSVIEMSFRGNNIDNNNNNILGHSRDYQVPNVEETVVQSVTHQCSECCAEL